MEALIYFVLITIAVSGVIGSFYMMLGRALIAVALTIFLPIIGIWYFDLMIYVWAFLIFTSDVGILAIGSFTFMYKRERKNYAKETGSKYTEHNWWK